MSLFKISKGLRINLPETKKDGWCYFTTDDQMFWVDYIDKNEELQRSPLNAQNSITFNGANLNRNNLENNENQVPSSEVMFLKVAELQTQITGNATDISTKMDKINPTGSGALSINRKENSVIGLNSVAIGNTNTASGSYSFSEGNETTASGSSSHAEGSNTTASANSSHAEGANTTASNVAAHAEGSQTTASEIATHAEGSQTTASGKAAHAEGNGTLAQGEYSHSSGNYTTATHKCQFVLGEYNLLDNSTNIPSARGNYVFVIGKGTSDSARSNALTVDWGGNIKSTGYIAHGNIAEGKVGVNAFAGGEGCEAYGAAAHAEGKVAIASGDFSHAEGQNTTASADSAHAEGLQTTASGAYSHAEGHISTASEIAAHAEGFTTTASGNYSHAEGGNTVASGSRSHAEGNASQATGNNSHAEGSSTQSSGVDSHAEGKNTQSIGEQSHTEGINTIAEGAAAHAEGNTTKANGASSHAEGNLCEASGNYSHAEGYESKATIEYSHAEGYKSIASGQGAHAGGFECSVSGAQGFVHGRNLTSTGDFQTVFGKYNDSADTSSAFVLGGGNTTAGRNIFTIDYFGNTFTDSTLSIGFSKDEMGSNALAVNGPAYFDGTPSVNNNYSPTEDNHLVTKKYVINNLPIISHKGITATEGQSIFLFGDQGINNLRNYYLVFYDGLLLMEGIHYNIVDNNKVVLQDWAAQASHMIHVLGFKPSDPDIVN